MSTDEATKERTRTLLEDAVARAMEAGWTAAEVLNEVEYISTCIEDDD